MIAIVWTFDHTLELAGVVVGAVAAIAAMVAAVFSIKGNKSSRELASAEALRWEMQIRPAPNVVILGLNEQQGYLSVNISNAGGAVAPGCVIACSRGAAFGQLIHIGAHAGPQEFHLGGRLYGFSLPAEDKVLLVVAKDVGGIWWDVLVGAKIGENVPLDLDAPGEFNEWCVQRLRGSGGPEVAVD